MKVTQSAPHPIHYYREKQLETEVLCDRCTLRYAIYGVFGWCPDCGVHNSLQILGKNLELAKKMLVLAGSAEKDLSDHLIGDALENVVSALDGFGREVCAQRLADIRFQNITAARQKVKDTFGHDFADGLTTDQWLLVCRVFQKRHLLAHKMGVVDEEYIQRANDTLAVIGRRIQVTSAEVTSVIGAVELLGSRLFSIAFSK
jgi:hypothetical protein